jgi:hypothetical protein
VRHGRSPFDTVASVVWPATSDTVRKTAQRLRDSYDSYIDTVVSILIGQQRISTAEDTNTGHRIALLVSHRDNSKAPGCIQRSYIFG